MNARQDTKGQKYPSRFPGVRKDPALSIVSAVLAMVSVIGVHNVF